MLSSDLLRSSGSKPLQVSDACKRHPHKRTALNNGGFSSEVEHDGLELSSWGS